MVFTRDIMYRKCRTKKLYIQEGYNLQKGEKIYAPKHVQHFFLQDKVSTFIDKQDTVDFTYFF